ncbi:alpha/beta hydrolase [Gallaecimonas kandeliae]|uniref:esterase/lipase family protein n=1 Tax=Gallaecimonas kandeliae TaxID=3029055 RepID=UPI0026491F8B|nr:alpha/beta hydrolase [Gallaecimonas kandeliae]WKE64729.1 alpha/beta hydrolase [Gallaecimonas kandeliae]
MRSLLLLLTLLLAACSITKERQNRELALWQEQAQGLGWLAEQDKGRANWMALALLGAEPGQDLRLYNQLLRELLGQCLYEHGNKACQGASFACGGPCSALVVPKDTMVDGKALGVSGYHYRPRNPKTEPFYPFEGLFEPLTFVTEIHSQSLVVKPLFLYGLPAGYRLDGQPLRLDYAMPYQALLSVAYIGRYENPGLFNADDTKSFGIYQLQPLDLHKDIVLMLHGLDSSPLIWRELSLAILRDPGLVARYQIWHLFYETGGPPLYNSDRVRRLLEERLAPFHAQGLHPHITLVGHSLGGIIAKALATDSGEVLWNATFIKSYPQMRQQLGEKVEGARRIFHFQHVPEVDKVVFMDTPHRGAPLSRSLLARIAAFFVSLPKRLSSAFSFVDQYQGLVKPQMRPYLQGRRPSSIEVLRADHPLIKALAEMHPAQGIRAWSVLGNQVPGCYSVAAHCSDDGVVKYQSAHQDYAPELIVEGHHDSYRNPQAIALVLNILSAGSGAAADPGPAPGIPSGGSTR